MNTKWSDRQIKALINKTSLHCESLSYIAEDTIIIPTNVQVNKNEINNIWRTLRIFSKNFLSIAAAQAASIHNMR